MPEKIEEISGPIEEILGRRRRPEKWGNPTEISAEGVEKYKKQEENQGKHTENEIFRRCAGQKLKNTTL